MLSIIIPSYKDPLLHKTIDSLLTNCKGDIEIIPVIDGYTLDKPITTDTRVKPIYQENTGMRGAINAGVKQARGGYIMRTDEHCMFAKGYDTALTQDIKDDWIVVPRRYQLDVEKWELMGSEYIDYEKLVIDKTHKKFHGIPWRSKTNERKDILLDEDMAMQGSCWVMKKSWWDSVIVELDSRGYGTHYQDSIEMIFKTWKAGGKLMLNKKTWYAHKHRRFKRTHNYPNELARQSWDFAINKWGDYYFDKIVPRFL